MKVTATLKNLRTSPRKVRLVAEAIKGMDANAALIQLPFIVKKSSHDLEKLLRSAIANARNNFGIDVDNLLVEEVRVGEGPRLKRWLPRAYGRATLILKRTSHISLTVAEKVEGKNRLSQEELAKERTKRAEAKRKALESLAAEQEMMEKEQAEQEESKSAEKKAPRVNKKGSMAAKKGQDGFLKKVFQRKAA